MRTPDRRDGWMRAAMPAADCLLARTVHAGYNAAPNPTPAPAGLRVDPCIPADWKELHVSRAFRGCRVEIDVRNASGAQKGVRGVSLDGADLDVSGGPVVPAAALAGKAEAHVQVEM